MVDQPSVTSAEADSGASLLSKADSWVASQFGLYAALRQCKSKHWRSAFAEFALTLIFSLLPIWVPLVALPMFGDVSRRVDQIVYSQIAGGELYILSAGLLAPIYYFTFPQNTFSSSRQMRPFPSQQVLILIFIAILCVAVLAIAATKVQATDAGIPERMIKLSQVLFLFCCAVFFLSLAVKNGLPDFVEGAFDAQSRSEQERIPPPDPVAPPAEANDLDDFVSQAIAEHAVQG